MQAAQGYEDLVNATRTHLEANGQLSKWRQQQQQYEASTLSRIEVCGACQGHRTEKVVYNQHLVLERTCEQCNGEGVITKEELASGASPARTRAPESTQVPSVRSA